MKNFDDPEILRQELEGETDFDLFELAYDDLRTMRVIRGKMRMAEKAKPAPDKALLAQWEEDMGRLYDEDIGLSMKDRDEMIRIIMKYTPQIRAWRAGKWREFDWCMSADGQPAKTEKQLEEALSANEPQGRLSTGCVSA